MSGFSPKKMADMLVSPKKATKLSEKEWFPFILVLREAKLVASFYALASKAGCFFSYPEYAQRHLKSDAVVGERQRAQVLFECATLTRVLSEIDVNPIYMKGANYVLRDTKNCRGRVVSDIDVLVDRQDLQKVERFLKTKLWQSDELSDYDEKYYRSWAHEIPPMYHLLRNTVLDIHHNIYLPISGRSPNIGSFTKGKVVAAHQCLVLSDPATVLHSIIHLFMNEDFTNSFRDMWDIHLLLVEFDSETFWYELNELSVASGFQKELYYALVLRERLFASDSPIVLSELRSIYSGTLTHFFIHKILYHALTPRHYLLDSVKSRVARLVVFIRGHWLKMPLPILVKHLTVKSYLGIVEKLFGKHFLDKE